MGRTTRLTTEEFIRRSQNIHGNTYDYSKTIYVNKTTKVIITCRVHGDIEIWPQNHWRSGDICNRCAYENNGKNARLPQEQFIGKAKKIHGDKYSYELVDYRGAYVKITLICPIHGNFQTVPHDLLTGYGCRKCGGTHPISLEDFIKRANIIHDGKYDYSEVKDVKAHNTVKLICPKHGLFFQKVYTHLNGSGCPICRTPKAELIISKWLNEHNIQYESQKTYSDLLSPLGYLLKFDFYLPDHRLLLEYDGEFHFRKIFDEDTFEKIQIHDKIKNKYASDNNIKLIRIDYTQNLDEELEKLLKDITK